MTATTTATVPARRRYAGQVGDMVDGQVVRSAAVPPPPPTTNATPRPVAPLAHPLPPPGSAMACLVPSLAIAPDVRKLTHHVTIVHVREALTAPDADRPDLTLARFVALPPDLQDADTFGLLVAAIAAYDRPPARAELVGKLVAAGLSRKGTGSAEMIANTWRPWRALLALAEARTLAAGPTGRQFMPRQWTLLRLGLAHQLDPSHVGDA